MENFYLKLHKGEEKPFFKKEGLDFFKSQSLFNKFKKGYNSFDKKLLKDLFLRQLLHGQTVCKDFPKRIILDTNSDILDQHIEHFKETYDGVDDFQTEGRLAIGLGNTSVFETSITLHHIYGFPYIPASSVKGILRSWIIREYFAINDNSKDSLINAESNALENEAFCLLFGCSKDKKTVIIDNEGNPIRKSDGKYKTKTELTALEKDHIGNIVFFDVYPIEPPNIEVDIINPHYTEYYKEGSKTPPADWQNPIPIFFLTLKKTPFQFLFGYRKHIVASEFERLQDIKFPNSSDSILAKEGTAIEVLSALLKEALDENGIGAKTAVDYGRMSSLYEEKKQKKQLALKKQAKLAKEQEEAKKRIEEQKRLEIELAEKKQKEIEELAFRQEQNRLKKIEKAEQIKNSGLQALLEDISDYETGKKIIVDFKKTIGSIPAAEYVHIQRFLSRVYTSLESKKEIQKWQKFKKNPWKYIASWTNKEVTQKWFDDIVSK